MKVIVPFGNFVMSRTMYIFAFNIIGRNEVQ